MFNLKEGQNRPVHAFRIEMKDHAHSISAMKNAFLQVKENINALKNKNFETVSDILSKRKLERKEKSIPFKLYWNSAKSNFADNEIFVYNIVKNTRKSHGQESTFKINDKYGLVVYVYLLDKNSVKSLTQFSENFVVELKTNAVIERATVQKPSNLIFEVKKDKETFFVKTKAEASYLEQKGYSSKSINFIEVNGRFFEIVAEIDSKQIKNVDIHSDKIKGYKTQKSAKLDGRAFFESTMEGISSKNYFTVDFSNAEPGFYKVYGEIEGYVLVESISTILNGKQSVLTFIKKNEKSKIELIKKSMTVID